MNFTISGHSEPVEEIKDPAQLNLGVHLWNFERVSDKFHPVRFAIICRAGLVCDNSLVFARDDILSNFPNQPFELPRLLSRGAWQLNIFLPIP